MYHYGESRWAFRKAAGVVLLLSLLLGLVSGVVVGIQLFQFSAVRLGFWESRIEATYIMLYSLRHQIQGSTSIRTTVGLGNTGAATISCNCTLYYKSDLGVQIAQHSFNLTVNAGQVRSEAFVVSPIDVSAFAGTDVSIFEY